MDQLVEGVLAVGAGLAPDHRAGVRAAGRCRPSPRACRCSPSPAAADRRAGATGAGRRAARRGWRSRRSGCARCRRAPAAPAGCGQGCGAEMRDPYRRPPARKRVEMRRARWRASAAGRSAPRANSARPPSRQSRTPVRARCRRPRCASAEVETAANCAPGSATLRCHPGAARCAALVIVSMVVKVFEATITSVVAGFERRQHVMDMRAIDVRNEMAARPGRA